MTTVFGKTLKTYPLHSLGTPLSVASYFDITTADKMHLLQTSCAQTRVSTLALVNLSRFLIFCFRPFIRLAFVCVSLISSLIYEETSRKRDSGENEDAFGCLNDPFFGADAGGGGLLRNHNLCEIIRGCEETKDDRSFLRGS